jgi:cytochrome o ubiquinol oxidase operon protein cyoD
MQKTREYRRQQLRYAYAYVLAGALSIVVYALAVGPSTFTDTTFAVIVLAAAALQLYIQSRYFLHLDDKEVPRWRLLSYAFTWFTLLIIAVGSIWIMNHLNYNMGMSPEQMDQYMNSQSLKGF